MCNNRKIKRWQTFQSEFLNILSDFEKDNFIPSMKKDFDSLYEKMQKIVELQESKEHFLKPLSEDWKKGLKELVDRMKEVKEIFTPIDSLQNLTLYLEKIAELSDQSINATHQIQEQIRFNVSDSSGDKNIAIMNEDIKLQNTQTISQRLIRNIEVWHKHRLELNKQANSIYLEERKISNANGIIFFEILGIVVGIIWGFVLSKQF